ncbi:MAG: OmpA family protein [Polyangiaceae bacterium]|nr:OmpA family protein [Polyangiaceae bacterium]
MSTAPATPRAFRAFRALFTKIAKGSLLAVAGAGCAGGGYTPQFLAPSEDPFFYGHDSGAFLGPIEPIPDHDADGNAIRLPRGAASFADEVIEYRMGNPRPVEEGRNAEAALGPPDYQGGPVLEAPRAVSLGQGGSLTLRFADNALIDAEGPDLYIFESGPDVEASFVEISADGREWIQAGRAGGHVSAIDIASAAKPGQVYSYVRLTDDIAQGNRGGEWPGADIDAVGAVGAVVRVELSSEVLFAFDSDRLLPGGVSALDGVLDKIAGRSPSHVTVLGHTDNIGEDAYNLDLSRRRAESVAKLLEERGISRSILTATGHGEARPVADNGSPEGRRRNRRVEIVIVGGD